MNLSNECHTFNYESKCIWLIIFYHIYFWIVVFYIMYDVCSGLTGQFINIIHLV